MEGKGERRRGRGRTRWDVKGREWILFGVESGTGLSDNRGSNIYPRPITGQIPLNHVRSAQTILPTRAIILSDIPSVCVTKFPIGLVQVVQLPNYRRFMTYS